MTTPTYGDGTYGDGTYGGNVPSEGTGRLRVDCYTPAGAKLASGPITEVLEFSYSSALDRIGKFSMTVPAETTQLNDLTQGSELQFVREGEGLLFRGLVEAFVWQLNAGKMVCVVTGPSIAQQLVFANTLLDLTFDGVTLAAAVNTLLTGTGWTSGTLAVPGTLLSYRFDGASIWEALSKVASVFGLHLREDNLNKQIDIAAFGELVNFRFQNVEGNFDQGLLEGTDYLVPLSSLQLQEESRDLWNSVIPLGSGEGISQLSLRYSDRSSPYTVSSAAGPNGQNYYYIEDSASVTAYGRRTKVVLVKEAIPLANSSAGFLRMANALYDVAANWLSKHKDPLSVYEAKVVGLKHLQAGDPLFEVGQKVRTIFRGLLLDSQGSPSLWKAVDVQLWLMGFTRSLKPGGADDWTLSVATVDRQQEDLADKLASAFSNLRVLQVAPTFYTFRDSYFLPPTSVDATHNAQLNVIFDGNISLVHKVQLTLQVQALRSNVSTISTDAGSAPTTSSGGSSTPTSSAETSHTHSVSAHTHSVTSATSAAGDAHTHSITTLVLSSTGSHRHIMFARVATAAVDSAAANPASTAFESAAGDPHTHGMSSHVHSIGRYQFAAVNSTGSNKTAYLADNASTVYNEDLYTYSASSDHTHSATSTSLSSESTHTHSVSGQTASSGGGSTSSGGSSHSHTVTVPAHTHSVTIPAHNHSLAYGIFESASPTNPGIGITINGVSRTVALGGPWSTVGSEITVDVTQYFQSGSTEQPLQQSNSVVITSDVLADVRAVVRVDATKSGLLPV